MGSDVYLQPRPLPWCPHVILRASRIALLGWLVSISNLLCPRPSFWFPPPQTFSTHSFPIWTESYFFLPMAWFPDYGVVLEVSLCLTPHRQCIIKYFRLSKCIQKPDRFWGHAWPPLRSEPVIIAFYFSIISNTLNSCQNCIKNSHIPITQIHYGFLLFFNYFTFTYLSFLPFLKHTNMTYTHTSIHAYILFWVSI